MPGNLVAFRRLLREARIIDDRYSVKGAMTWLPFGVKLKGLVHARICDVFTAAAFEEYSFPILARRSDLRHIESLIGDLQKHIFDLGNGMVLRPGGEALVYPMLSKWIGSYKDLPLRVWQSGPVFRSGRSRGLLIAPESDWFTEAYTAHETASEAESQLQSDICVVRSVLESLGIPLIVSDRPLATNKPVSIRTIGFDALLPTGETVLVGSAYLQMQLFSRLYGIRFRTRTNELAFTSQTCLGFSQRALLASLAIHADDTGLRLLPSIAPTQTVIVPLEDSEEAIRLVDNVYRNLTQASVRTRIDRGQTGVSACIALSERQGIPLRILVGRREAAAGQVTIVRRDEGTQIMVMPEHTPNTVRLMLDAIEKALRGKAAERLASHTVAVARISDVAESLRQGFVARSPLCKNDDCLKTMERDIAGEVLGYDFTLRGGVCAVCRRATESHVFAARRF